MKKNFFAAAMSVCIAVAVSACGSNGLVTKGDTSVMDTLSYALGSNIGFGVKYEFVDIPFDYKAIVKGIEEAALDKSSITQEQAVDTLRSYFMERRMQRSRAVAEKRRLADSVRFANGDSTVIEHMADPDMFASEQERYDISYSFGVDIGSNVKASNVPVQTYWLTQGFTEVQDGNNKLNESEVTSFLQNYFMVVRPAELKEESEQWLAKMEKKSGVKKTESGLLYKVINKGDSELQASDDRDVVVVKYRGTTRNGKEFDSSYQREEDVKKQIEEVKKQIKELGKNKELTEEEKVNENGRYDRQLAQLERQLEQVATAEFPLNRVIRGWTEGMKLVGKGGKITLWIPSDMAYGPQGAGRDIGPNEALRFDVEIIDVKPFEQPAPVVPEVEEEE